jgi:hypothetical protein
MLSCIGRGELVSRAYHQYRAFMPDILGFTDSDRRTACAAPIKKRAKFSRVLGKRALKSFHPRLFNVRFFAGDSWSVRACFKSPLIKPLQHRCHSSRPILAPAVSRCCFSASIHGSNRRLNPLAPITRPKNLRAKASA